MFANWTFGKRLALGFGLAGLTLLLVALVSYRSTSQLIDNNDWVSHTHEVRRNLASLLLQLTNAETGGRGYILTGDDSYLEPYNAARAVVSTTYEHLRTLTADNEDQQKRLDLLAPLLDARMKQLADVVDLRRTQGFDAALQYVTSGKGQDTMDQIRSLLAAADQAEADLLDQRTADAKESASLATGIVLWGGLAGALVVAGIGWFITLSLGKQIGAAVTQIQSSSAELQAAANQQAAGMREQATSMAEIATTIGELLATARQIAESAKRVSQIADQTASAAASGDGTVGAAHGSIAGIRQQVDMVVSHMLELGKKSQEIGAVLEIVSELAEQTNILSINATIEAAGAGEAGKRFGVVADEIRKLADRVADSAKEIRTLIDDVRSSVNTTVMATETGSKAVDSGSNQFSEVATSFKQISSLVTTTTEAAREIELSTKQQSSAVEQVNLAIAGVSQAAKESEVSAAQTLQTAGQLAGLSKSLLRLVQAHAAA
jgi:methyl-accepting chemotaxis protein